MNIDDFRGEVKSSNFPPFNIRHTTKPFVLFRRLTAVCIGLGENGSHFGLAYGPDGGLHWARERWKQGLLCTDPALCNLHFCTWNVNNGAVVIPTCSFFRAPPWYPRYSTAKFPVFYQLLIDSILTKHRYY